MNQDSQHVLSRRLQSGVAIILNRPDAINSLTEKMIDRIDALMDQAAADEHCRFVLFYATGSKGFCAGGDIKELARLARLKQYDKVDSFFQKEYDLDLKIHLFPKPVIVIADGITMGGGLGIAAGADMRIATDRTRMAMPETRIGFFPDVGSTGWMFMRCPKGYPEYLGLTGYDMQGLECVRLGFATHFTFSDRVPELVDLLECVRLDDSQDRLGIVKALMEKISGLLDLHIPVRYSMDAWVKEYFSGKTDIRDILASLSKCGDQEGRCNEVFVSIAERSPTALVLTLKLLRYNEGRSITDVFATELKAAKYMSRQPDYLEGIRARLIERDNQPRWQPDRIDLVDPSGFIP
ncbi:MAG: putative enoyl-CoA hydratase [Deltaproteobacteria bacterium ADurb.Bin151]|jgi:enoyl-CoA hydratase/carnithine racemase|nr:MAG: putative enoyl-CoA hydratase [Deltaproteobacteria bacterium ADurb.Bin151]HNZ11044.1 enoyl-CoA hydratase/isomerase family protein [Smithellaceae bacterium]HOG81900.1 enoyl-CoA hydratase/isomerase family protein [Smithellaceae bacterium]HOQ42517.1 enoyl-CoA hydratase/isomerase family protein [Smithellaceae bacterium]HPL65125.1 enoyl-CoA hydratase/isomerase family protein [Smithellaceae bacterium]